MKVSCPTIERMRAFLDNRLPESERQEVAALLESNEEYARKLEEVATGGKDLAAVLKGCDKEKPADTSAYWPALQKIEQELKSTPSPDLLGVTHPEGESPTKTKELKIDFLDPPERDGSIGVLDRFHILNLVGRGGMGIVLKAMDGCLEREVAIKMLDPQFAKNDQAHDRFCREARSAAKIMHENVVTIHHVDENEKKELPYIVMQFVEGQSLQERLDEAKPLPLYDIVRIGKQTAAGLAAAHAKNLIHRDIKPANILLEAGTDRVLLTDFGLARMNEDVKLTQTGFVAGTPLFMSPEQARGEAVDYRSDLFSLGSVLYAMCTGKPPFEGSTPFLVLRSVTELNPKPIHIVNPDVPDWLVDVIDKLLAKDPRKRFGSAAEVAELLDVQLSAIPRKSKYLTGTTRSSLLPRISGTKWGRRLGYAGLASLTLGVAVGASEAAKATRWTILGQRGQVPRAVGGVFDDQPATPKMMYDGKAGPVWNLAMHPKGETVAMAIEDGTVKVYDLRTGVLKSSFTAHTGPIWSIAYNHEGTLLLTGSDDGFAKLWDTNGNKEVDDINIGVGVRSVAFSNNGKRFATGHRNGAVRVWDTATRKSVAATEGHSGTVTYVEFSPDDSMLASASADKSVKIWDVTPGLERFPLKDGAGSVYAVTFDPTGKYVATGGWDHKLRIWDLKEGKLVKTIDAHKEDIWALAFDPKGSRLVSVGSDRMVKTWDTKTWTECDSFRAHTGAIYSVVMQPDGREFATAGRDGTVQLWDLK